MAYKRNGSPYYQVRPRIPAYGRITALSTKTKDRNRAVAMESLLRDLPTMGFGDLVEAVIQREISLPRLYSAHLANSLPALREQRKDPPLSVVVESFRFLTRDDRVLQGLDQLLELAPQGTRLSWLADPKHITTICAQREAQGIKPNSVRRSLYRAISDLLAHEFGKARKTAILTDVIKPKEKDLRDVILTPDQIEAVLDRCDEEFRLFVATALLTGVDRGPLLRLTVSYFDEARGRLHVPDTKTDARLRTIGLSPEAQSILRLAVRGKRPSDLVFSYRSPWQVRRRWDTVRAAAGVPTLRFKDLRHVFAQAFIQGGGSLSDLRIILGHSDPKTTMRYLHHQAVGDPDVLDRAAAVLRIGRHTMEVIQERESA